MGTQLCLKVGGGPDISETDKQWQVWQGNFHLISTWKSHLQQYKRRNELYSQKFDLCSLDSSRDSLQAAEYKYSSFKGHRNSSMSHE